MKRFQRKCNCMGDVNVRASVSIVGLFVKSFVLKKMGGTVCCLLPAAEVVDFEIRKWGRNIDRQ